MTSFNLRPARGRRGFLATTCAVLAASALPTTAGTGTRIVPGWVSLDAGKVAAAEPCSGSLIFRFTGAEQWCVVPGGISRVEIVAVGGRGGSGAAGCCRPRAGRAAGRRRRSVPRSP
jgi:hypothetical protein